MLGWLPRQPTRWPQASTHGPSCLLRRSATRSRSRRWLSAVVASLPLRAVPWCQWAVPAISDASWKLFGPRGLDARLAGLCDAGEEGDVRRGLEWAGLGFNLRRADLEALGFYVCVADLEDELIRCLDAARVEQVVAAQGELGSFRTFQQQPAWQGRSSQAQLRRFIGAHSGRKVRYTRLLVDALELTSVPRPLDRVLAHI
jgi:hypothetical protein